MALSYFPPGSEQVRLKKSPVRRVINYCSQNLDCYNVTCKKCRIVALLHKLCRKRQVVGCHSNCNVSDFISAYDHSSPSIINVKVAELRLIQELLRSTEFL